MVTLSSGFVLKSARRGKRVLFSRYLLATNTVISACSSGLGDSLQQQYEMVRNRMDGRNFTRTRNIAFTGVPIGIACHYWYIYLDKWLPGRTLKTVGKKILLDQLVCSPVVIGIFLVTLGVLEHTSVQSVARDLWDKGSTLYTAEWLIWPPAQLVNFLFLPTRFRVLYDSAISLGFDCYYPYVSYRQEHRRTSKQGHDSHDDSKSDVLTNCDQPNEQSAVKWNECQETDISKSLIEVLVCCSFV